MKTEISKQLTLDKLFDEPMLCANVTRYRAADSSRPVATDTSEASTGRGTGVWKGEH